MKTLISQAWKAFTQAIIQDFYDFRYVFAFLAVGALATGMAYLTMNVSVTATGFLILGAILAMLGAVISMVVMMLTQVFQLFKKKNND